MKGCLRWGPEGSQVPKLLPPWSLGTPASSRWMCPVTCKLPKPHSSGIFMAALSHRHDRWLTESPVSLLSPEIESFGLLIMAWSFRWAPPFRRYLRARQDSPHDDKRRSYHPGNVKEFRNSVWDAPITSMSSGNDKGFRSCLSGTGGRGQIFIFYYATYTYTVFSELLTLTPVRN